MAAAAAAVSFQRPSFSSWRLLLGLLTLVHDGGCCRALEESKNGNLPNGFFVLDPNSLRHSPYFDNDNDDDDAFEWALNHIPFVDIVVVDHDNSHASNSSNSNSDSSSTDGSSSSTATRDLLTAYYYRWKSFRKHIHRTENDGYIITEFRDPMPWGGRYGTIPAAAGHHILEGRWLTQPQIMNDYITFWMTTAANNPNQHPSDDSHDDDDDDNPYPPITDYTHWIGYAMWQRYLLDGNVTFVQQWLEPMVRLFRTVYIPKYLRNITTTTSATTATTTTIATATTKHLRNTTTTTTTAPRSPPRPNQCWWQEEGNDAMEVSISGSGCRPTLAAAMFGESQVILHLARLNNNHNHNNHNHNNNTTEWLQRLQDEFAYWNRLSQQIVLHLHWNDAQKSFAVVPLSTDNATYDEAKHPSVMPHCNLTATRLPKNEPLRVRELFGYVPWYFEGLIPDASRARYLPQWRHLLDPHAFAAPYGLTSTERRHSCFNFSFIHGNCWNGPSWPFETSRVLTAAANVLNWPYHHRKNNHDTKNNDNDDETTTASTTTTTTTTSPLRQDSFTQDDYFDLLLQYARQHTQTFALNDTAVPLHSGHVFENLHPTLGYWNNRFYLYGRNSTRKNKGDDYNHSTFADLILGGLLGIRPQPDGSLWIRPLIPTDRVPWFVVDHVPVRYGRFLAVTWKKSDSRAATTRTRNTRGDDDKYPLGLTVYVNGQVVANRETMGPLRITLEQLQQSRDDKNDAAATATAL